MAELADNDSLTEKQRTFVTALLASSGNVVVAAKTARISERTGHRWLKLEVVRAAYREAQKALDDEMWEQVKHDLLAAVPKALEVLAAHKSAKVKPTAATQLRAAEIVLDRAIGMNKMAELEVEVAELKRLLGEREQWQQ